MQPVDRVEIIGGKRYNTQTATLIASDAFWDGHNYERRGTNTFLFRTPKGRYFTQVRSQWEGADDGKLTPYCQEDALRLWGELREHEVSFEEAFPGVEVEDA